MIGFDPNSESKNNRSALKILPGKILLGVILVLCILFGGYTFTLWVALDYSPNFWQIDHCLDRGGVWDDTDLVCIDK
ncbi:MAG: hypothetical protein KAJ29_05305 [Alphaproteobacteria bacterium]|nr:hypothetical protein [Alphaproteobacteria bacterium]